MIYQWPVSDDSDKPVPCARLTMSCSSCIASHKWTVLFPDAGNGTTAASMTIFYRPPSAALATYSKACHPVLGSPITLCRHNIIQMPASTFGEDVTRLLHPDNLTQCKSPCNRNRNQLRGIFAKGIRQGPRLAAVAPSPPPTLLYRI